MQYVTINQALLNVNAKRNKIQKIYMQIVDRQIEQRQNKMKTVLTKIRFKIDTYFYLKYIDSYTTFPLTYIDFKISNANSYVKCDKKIHRTSKFECLIVECLTFFF